MAKTFCFAIAGALVVPTLAFNYHWFEADNDRSGWISTGCATAAVLFLVLAMRLP